MMLRTRGLVNDRRYEGLRRGVLEKILASPRWRSQRISRANSTRKPTIAHPIFPDSPRDASYLPASEARRAALINAVAVFILGHKDRSVADGRWNSIYTPASPPALVPSCAPDAQTLSICISICEAKSSSLPRRCYPRRLSVEAQCLIAARARERGEIFVIKQRPPTQRPQPPQNIFKKGWNLIKLKDMIHDKIYPSSLDITQAYARRTEYKK